MTQTEIVGLMEPKGGHAIGRGSTGTVFAFADKPDVVAKLPFVTDRHKARFETEKAIFRRLGSHPHIVPCLEIQDDDFSGGRIYMRLAEHNSVRQYFRQGGKASLSERVRWSLDVAETLQFLHDHQVRWGDVGGRNVLLTADRVVWLCDFSGSGLDGEPPIVWAEAGFRHPDDEADETRTGTLPCEIHALGSTIYELITSKMPHWEEKEKCEESWMEPALDLLRDGIYPDVSDMALGDVIQGCWKGKFASAQEVADSIREKLPQYINNDEMV